MSLAARIAQFDLTLFDHVRSQTAPYDKRVLLALYQACRETYGTFRYLEIGSHKGGSLQVLIRDPACESIVSIDARLPLVRDAARGEVSYGANTTERMIRLLAQLPDADFDKLHTLDASTDNLQPWPFNPHLAFVDAEHTDEAALRDARFCRDCGAKAVLFHDSEQVGGAIRTFCAEWRAQPRFYRRSMCLVEPEPVLQPFVARLVAGAVLG